MVTLPSAETAETTTGRTSRAKDAKHAAAAQKPLQAILLRQKLKDGGKQRDNQDKSAKR